MVETVCFKNNIICVTKKVVQIYIQDKKKKSMIDSQWTKSTTNILKKKFMAIKHTQLYALNKYNL